MNSIKMTPKSQDVFKLVEDPFTTRLASLVSDPPETSIKAQITPKMAMAMLDYNTRNRPVKGGKVALYARQMEAGEWRYTREPIIFSDAGRVIDGQHRLMACIEAEAPFTADVAFGAPDEAFAFIDVGAPRTAGDIFAINGVKSSIITASMTRMVWKYQRGRNTVDGGTGGKLTNAELYEEFLKMDGLQDSLPIVYKFQSSRLASPSVMGALHYICSRKNRAKADEFFHKICDGGAGNGPAAELHRRLVKNATSADKMRVDYLAGLVLTAWNRDRKGLSGRGLSFAGGKLPAVQ